MPLAFTFYKQQNINGCGLACLRMICRYHGLNNTFNSDAHKRRLTPRGLSLLDIKELAAEAGFDCVAQKCTIDELKQVGPLPAIVLLQNAHYAVIYELGDDKVYIADPACGLKEYRHVEFNTLWYHPESGQGVLVSFTKSI